MLVKSFKSIFKLKGANQTSHKTISNFLNRCDISTKLFLTVFMSTLDATMYQRWSWRWPDSRDWWGRRLERVLFRIFHWLRVYFSDEFPGSRSSPRKCRSNGGAHPEIKSPISHNPCGREKFLKASLFCKYEEILLILKQ